VLLITRPHLVSHMDAPLEWLDELDDAQALVRQFLVDTFGRAGFWERGGPDKEVGHAHLHGAPVDLALEHVRPVRGWSEVREQRDYVYASGSAGACLVLDYPAALAEVRRQFVAQTGARQDGNGPLLRLGPEMVDRTRALWKAWARKT